MSKVTLMVAQMEAQRCLIVSAACLDQTWRANAGEDS